jgi:hypothetical protein
MTSLKEVLSLLGMVRVLGSIKILAEVVHLWHINIHLYIILSKENNVMAQVPWNIGFRQANNIWYQS